MHRGNRLSMLVMQMTLTAVGMMHNPLSVHQQKALAPTIACTFSGNELLQSNVLACVLAVPLSGYGYCSLCSTVLA